MTTLLQLRTRARERADQVGSTFVTDTELTTNINLGLSELYDLVVSAFEDYFTISTTLTVSSGDTAALPADFYKLRGLDYDNNGRFVALRQFEFNERNSAQNQDLFFWRGYTVPRRYRIIGDSLLLQPSASAVGSYKLWYAPAPTLLVADGDTIPTALSKFGWDEYIALYAAERMLSKEESSITDLRNQRAEIADRIRQMSANRQVDQSDSIQDVRQDWYEY